MSRQEVAFQRYLEWVNKLKYLIFVSDTYSNKTITFEIDKYYHRGCKINYNPLILEYNLLQKDNMTIDKDIDLGMENISHHYAKEVHRYLFGFTKNLQRR